MAGINKRNRGRAVEHTLATSPSAAFEPRLTAIAPAQFQHHLGRTVGISGCSLPRSHKQSASGHRTSARLRRFTRADTLATWSRLSLPCLARDCRRHELWRRRFMVWLSYGRAGVKGSQAWVLHPVRLEPQMLSASRTGRTFRRDTGTIVFFGSSMTRTSSPFSLRSTSRTRLRLTRY
jgi:hypothetical protein